ncbi:MAG: hypothetical protein HY782_18705 [Chloroflexi bacterium]|nr:hypothetical protein [Chloroflexota bacterium]
MEDTRILNKRYETVAWGAFFILLGVTGLIPGVPEGTGTLGVGIILLGLNLARYLSHIRTSGFTITLGMIAILFGIADVLRAVLGLRVELPFFPILLITIGVIWLVRAASTNVKRMNE